MKTQELFELDTETLIQQADSLPPLGSSAAIMSGWYSFQFELPVKLTKEDAMLIASRVASMADGVLTHFDYVEYGTGEDDDYYEIVIFFETENKAHNALKVLRRVSRGKPSFEWVRPGWPTPQGAPIIEREPRVWGNIIEPMLESQELFEQEEWEDYSKQTLAAELNWYIEEDTFWYKDMGIDPLPPGYPIKPLAISDTMLKEFNDVMSGLTGDYESGQMSEDSLATERRYLYVDLINDILKIDWEAHLNKLERRSEVARRRQEK